jgi:hypothetical protein
MIKIVFGAVFILASLLILGLGRRKAVALVIGVLTLALGGWWLYGGIVATGRREAAAAFIAAAERGDLATIRRMADENPMFVNASESHDDDSTVWPITVAAKELHADVVEFLLSRGAIVDADTDDRANSAHGQCTRREGGGAPPRSPRERQGAGQLGTNAAAPRRELAVGPFRFGRAAARPRSGRECARP